MWGACDPNEPKNRRTRCSILVQLSGTGGSTDVLVDTSPDMREQLLAANLTRLDAVLYTHDHADQTHGIDDLRGFAILQRRRVPVYFDEATASSLMTRFGYCFHAEEGSGYPAILDAHRIEAFRALTIDGPGGALAVLPFDQAHGRPRSLGFRFGPIAYSSDLNDLPEASFAALEGVECWIVDALRYVPHPSHAHLARTLEWIGRVKPKRAILTNLHQDLDYNTLKAELPEGVEPGYDGMVVTF
jgi:phosphoribosyl 1,2-cyclic phosphate phosphodiesterase